MGVSASVLAETGDVRLPVSQVPLRLRKAHPHAFVPYALYLGPTHLDKEWNDSRDSKSHAVFSSLSKPDSGFLPEELWLSVADNIVNAEPAFSTIKTKFPQDKTAPLAGDFVYLISSFLADLHASPETMRGKYGAAAIHDAAKLDNQLPLDLLQAVVAGLPSALEKAASKKQKEAAMLRAPFAASEFPKVVENFCRFYSPFPHAELLNFDLGKKKSLLDCLHASVSGEFQFTEKKTGTARLETVERDSPTAKEMVQAGIRFEPGQAKNIAETRFEDGVLRLPPLVIGDVTETVIRNLMVLEEALYEENPVSEYVRFLKGIVESGDDAAVLREAGVLQGYYGKDERVAEFIKSLDDCYIFRPFYFLPFRKGLEDMKAYCEQKKKEANRSAVPKTTDEGKEAVCVDGSAVSGKVDEGKEKVLVDARKGINVDSLVVAAAIAVEKKVSWKALLAVVAIISGVGGYLFSL